MSTENDAIIPEEQPNHDSWPSGGESTENQGGDRDVPSSLRWPDEGKRDSPPIMPHVDPLWPWKR
jgi:hypothetical protein